MQYLNDIQAKLIYLAHHFRNARRIADKSLFHTIQTNQRVNKSILGTLIKSADRVFRLIRLRMACLLIAAARRSAARGFLRSFIATDFRRHHLIVRMSLYERAES